MSRNRFLAIAFVVPMSLAALLFLSGVATAQNVKVEGLINGRNGDTMTLQTSDSPKLGMRRHLIPKVHSYFNVLM
jgi:hypothetical protein